MIRFYITIIFISSLCSQTHNDFFYITNLFSNGRDIVFVKENNSTTLTTRLGASHYPHYNNPKLSPDRSKILFQVDTDGHDRYSIWVMNLDGSNIKKLTEKEGLYPNWHPDGKTIYYSGRRNGVWEILSKSVSGGPETNLSENKKRGYDPGWGAPVTVSPDGQSLVYCYIREKRMYSLKIKSNKITALTLEGERYMHPVFSNDGKHIAVNKHTGSHYDLIVFSIADRSEKIMAKNVISYSAPSWSKNNDYILFSKESDGSQNIFMVDLITKKISAVVENNSMNIMPIW